MTEPPTAADRRAARATLVLIAATTIVRVLAVSLVGLGNGEAYYFSCARTPMLSYVDHPPLAIWLGTLCFRLFGAPAALGFRLPFLLMFAGSTWLIFLIGKRLFGARAGFWAAVALNLSAVFSLSTACFFQPDGPMVLFWLAAVLCLTHIFFPPQPRHPVLWWLAAGAMLGLGMLCKYPMVFLAIGVLAFLLTQKEHRWWLIHPGPYLAAVIAAAVFSPVLVWNAQHEWISFLWQGRRGLESDGLRWDWLVRNILGQGLWLLPWIWAPLLGQLYRGLRGGPRDEKRWFFATSAVGPIALFTVVSAYAPIGLHFHWQAPGYLMLLAPLGDAVARGLARGSATWRRWAAASAAVTCVLVALLVAHTAAGKWLGRGPEWLSNALGAADDLTLETLDYSPLPDALARHGLLEKPHVFVFTDRWHQSGKVDYALGGRMPVLCLNPAKPVSYPFLSPPARYRGWDAVLVCREDRFENVVSWHGRHFEAVKPLAPLPLIRGGRVVGTLRLAYCRNFRSPPAMPYP